MNKLTKVLKIGSSFLYICILSSSLIVTKVSAESSYLSIGFGSCSDQKREQPIWDNIAKHNPDLFVLMGDNVYIDSPDPAKMKAAYLAFSKEPHFKNFRKTTPLIATWDDHDYGKSDSGKEFEGNHLAKEAFLDFFDYPELDQVKNRLGGIFHSKWLELNDKKIQIIMLDTRWYRDSLTRSYLTDSQRLTLNLGPYQPNLDRATTLLGIKQWAWLEAQLKQPTDLRILVSSIQVLTEYSGWETWANFPHEREKLLNMLQEANHDNIIILSGDIHRAEIVKVLHKKKELLEITSSGLAVKTYPAAENIHRVGNAFEQKNYGMLTISDIDNKLVVDASIFDENGNQQLSAKLGD